MTAKPAKYRSVTSSMNRRPGLNEIWTYEHYNGGQFVCYSDIRSCSWSRWLIPGTDEVMFAFLAAESDEPSPWE
jgi:hypothetical protein